MLTLRIALRYLLSRKSHSVINVVSLIAVVGVSIATMAIVIVLSVFNGFRDLAYNNLSSIDPDLKVVYAGGTMGSADSVAARVRTMPGVSGASVTLTRRALYVDGGEQFPVVFTGVDRHYATHSPLPMTMGIATDVAVDSMPAMQVAVGVAARAGSGPGDVATLYVPRRLGRINPSAPATAFRSSDMMLTGVYQVNQPEYDLDHVMVPLEQARYLMQYEGGEGDAIEVWLDNPGEAASVARTIEGALGPGYRALDRLEQQHDTFRMISVEKWVTLLMLVFILVVASFNIISTLSLMVIDKASNIATMRAMGATRAMVRRIFVLQGWLITVAGGVVGIALGAVLCLLQQWCGIVKLNADPERLTIDTYPVALSGLDLLIVLGIVVVLGAVISQITRWFVK